MGALSWGCFLSLCSFTSGDAVPWASPGAWKTELPKHRVSLTRGRPGSLHPRALSGCLQSLRHQKSNSPSLCNNPLRNKILPDWKHQTIFYRPLEEAKLVMMGPESPLTGSVQKGSWRRAREARCALGLEEVREGRGEKTSWLGQ